MRMRTAALAYVAIGLSVTVACAVRGQHRNTAPSDRAAEFRKRYAKSVDDKYRRDVVTNAIDDGLISVPAKLADVRALFGDDLVREGTDPIRNGDTTRNVVRYRVLFHPPERGDNPMVSPAISGWYLRLYFLDDQLVNYRLSNVHKSVWDN